MSETIHCDVSSDGYHIRGARRSTMTTSWCEDFAKLTEIIDREGSQTTDIDRVARAIMAAGFHTR